MEIATGRMQPKQALEVGRQAIDARENKLQVFTHQPKKLVAGAGPLVSRPCASLSFCVGPAWNQVCVVEYRYDINAVLLFIFATNKKRKQVKSVAAFLTSSLLFWYCLSVIDSARERKKVGRAERKRLAFEHSRQRAIAPLCG